MSMSMSSSSSSFLANKALISSKKALISSRKFKKLHYTGVVVRSFLFRYHGAPVLVFKLGEFECIGHFVLLQSCRKNLWFYQISAFFYRLPELPEFRRSEPVPREVPALLAPQSFTRQAHSPLPDFLKNFKKIEWTKIITFILFLLLFAHFIHQFFLGLAHFPEKMPNILSADEKPEKIAIFYGEYENNRRWTIINWKMSNWK